MTKRDIFTELMQGIADLRKSRERKLVIGVSESVEISRPLATDNEVDLSRDNPNVESNGN